MDLVYLQGSRRAGYGTDSRPHEMKSTSGGSCDKRRTCSLLSKANIPGLLAQLCSDNSERPLPVTHLFSLRKFARSAVHWRGAGLGPSMALLKPINTNSLNVCQWLLCSQLLENFDTSGLFTFPLWDDYCQEVILGVLRCRGFEGQLRTQTPKDARPMDRRQRCKFAPGYSSHCWVWDQRPGIFQTWLWTRILNPLFFCRFSTGVILGIVGWMQLWTTFVSKFLDKSSKTSTPESAGRRD